MKALAPRIAVIGSINMDLVVRCKTLPLPGQTLLARSSTEVCGGKGANQAVAAARAGGDVTMIGRVGDDAFAERLVANLQQANIQTDHVLGSDKCASGLAVIAVEDSGENSILVVPGANARITVQDIENARPIIESSEFILLQLEIPLDAVEAAIRIAKAADVRVILDPAPAPAVWPDFFFQVDLVCPNESEAAAFSGSDSRTASRSVSPEPVETIQQAETVARKMHARGIPNVAITMGSRGTLLFDGKTAQLIPPFTVQTIDSTAAGDAWAGAMAVYWAEHHPLADAVRFGNAAGAMAASRAGAQPSLPTRSEIEEKVGG